MSGPGLLAKTTYVAGPNDAVAVIDVYKKPTSAVVNSWQDVGARVGLDISAAFGGVGKGQISALLKLTSDGKIQLSAQGILNRMTGGNSPLASAFRDVSAGVKAAIALPGQLINSVSATINGTVRAVSAAAMDDVRGIASVINAATNGSYGISITDNGAMAGMVASVSLQGSALGLPKVFSTLSLSIQSPSVLNTAASMIMRTATKLGNYDLIADIASTSVGRQMGALYPNVISDMVQGYRLPANTNQATYPGQYVDMKDTMDAIVPDWDAYYRNGGTILSTSALNKANRSVDNLIVASAYSQGNSDMYSSLQAGTSAAENMTNDKVMMCARNEILIDGEPQVTNLISQRYPLVDSTTIKPPTTTAADKSKFDPQFLYIDGEAQKTTINGKTYDPNTLYIDGEAAGQIKPEWRDQYGKTAAERKALALTNGRDLYGYTKEESEALPYSSKSLF